jgi:uncharacterized linocin/CFP29 family protein
MMSKHPLDLPVGRKLSREEVAEALRLAIIAELDAINLYLQLARAIDIENVRKVFEEIAREEKTHVGEFLAVLKSLDPEQVEELKKGAEEVKELTGIQIVNTSSDPPQQSSSGEWFVGVIASEVKKVVDNTRNLVKKLPVITLGRGVDVVVVERVDEKIERISIPLCEISYRFKVSQKAIDYASRYKQAIEIAEAIKTGFSLASDEEKLVVDTLLKEGKLRFSMSRWEEPGASVIEIAKTVTELAKKGYRKPYILILNPSRYIKLLIVSEKTGVTDLERVKMLIDEVVITPAIPDEKAIILSSTPEVLDIVYGGNSEVDYVGPEDGFHVFRLWSSLAMRIKLPEGIAILEEVQK